MSRLIIRGYFSFPTASRRAGGSWQQCGSTFSRQRAVHSHSHSFRWAALCPQPEPTSCKHGSTTGETTRSIYSFVSIFHHVVTTPLLTTSSPLSLFLYQAHFLHLSPPSLDTHKRKESLIHKNLLRQAPTYHVRSPCRFQGSTSCCSGHRQEG